MAGRWPSVAAALLFGWACGEEVSSPPAPVPPVAPAAESLVEPERPAEPDAGPRARGHIEVVVLRSFPDSLRAPVEEALEARLGLIPRRGPTLELPREAYYEPRRRYRADRLLPWLRERAPVDRPRHKVLGLTEVDLSVTKRGHRDWGIVGRGDHGGPAAVMSLFRLRRDDPTPERLAFRIAAMTVHEVGHTLGLGHCAEEGCVMNDLGGRVASVDASTGRLGPGCRAEVERSLPPLPLAELGAPR